MDLRAVRLLWYGQFCFYAGVIAAIILKPAGLAANDGISYYGHFRYTFVPYAVALLGSGYFCWQVARRITNPSLRPVGLVLKLAALCEAAICAAPVTLTPWLRHVHTTAGSILFSAQLLLSGWLVIKLHFQKWAIFYATLELAGGIGAAVWLLPKHGFLLQSQVIFQLGFSGLLLLAGSHFRTYLRLGRLAKQPVVTQPETS